MELEISDNVLALLMKDIQRLPVNLQFGLHVASCIGVCVTDSMLNYLSIDLGLDLKDILHQAPKKGFMININDSTMFCFEHDKIQEAVYELMPDLQRFGLALCTHTLNSSVEDDELFFAAINQINQGGPAAVHMSSQKSVFSELNLKAGMHSILITTLLSRYFNMEYHSWEILIGH